MKMSPFTITRRALPALGASTLLPAQVKANDKDAIALPDYACRMHHQSLRQSSWDRTGGNADRWVVGAGETKEVFRSSGPGVVTHLWFTIASPSPSHLKDLVLRAFWDGSKNPSIEVPIGDFFGLNLGSYHVYQSAFLNCSSRKGLNSYFAMPFQNTAVITVTNEGKRKVDALYSNIDYQLVTHLPADALYFHAQYRQATPEASAKSDVNLDGRNNYVLLDTKGSGHLMGVTVGIIQTEPRWMGEGDDMTFIDGSPAPQINGTGTEDYFCGAWNFGGPDNALPFAHLYNGAHVMEAPEVTGGRYCLYRWHADNPITFNKQLLHTIEHGHANDRADHFCSVAYWYQTQPASDFPPLPGLTVRQASI